MRETTDVLKAHKAALEETLNSLGPKEKQTLVKRCRGQEPFQGLPPEITTVEGAVDWLYGLRRELRSRLDTVQEWSLQVRKQMQVGRARVDAQVMRGFDVLILEAASLVPKMTSTVPRFEEVLRQQESGSSDGSRSPPHVETTPPSSAAATSRGSEKVGAGATLA